LTAEIFREDAGGAALGGCRNDQGVPEADLGFVLDVKGGGNFGRCGFRASFRVGVHYQARGLFWQGRGDLACDVDVKFLEHLHAEHAGALGPEFTKDGFSDSVLGACVCVMGVYQDIGVDECFAGHFAGPLAKPFIGHAAGYRYRSWSSCRVAWILPSLKPRSSKGCGLAFGSPYAIEPE
jgi:hypothetical protein